MFTKFMMNLAMTRFRAAPRNKLRGALHDGAIVSYLSEVKRNFFGNICYTYKITIRSIYLEKNRQRKK